MMEEIRINKNTMKRIEGLMEMSDNYDSAILKALDVLEEKRIDEMIKGGMNRRKKM